MAITDIKAYAHLTQSDVETLCAELDAIRRTVEQSRGDRDTAYILRTIKLQRALEMAGRATLFASRRRTAWLLGTGLLAAAKVIEMMELGHNITHGQWDWMNDPEIHSSTWEWDFVGPSAHWKRSHNYVHHAYTNVVGLDEDLSFVVLRMTRDEPWRPIHLMQPVFALGVALLFEWIIALHDWALERTHTNISRRDIWSKPDREFVSKIARQVGKDFLFFPALTGRAYKHTLTANASALLLRNLWSYLVIMCGHFPDGAEKFTIEQFEHETRGEWYLRQLLGTANISAGPVLAFMTGNLCYQIEHHLFPDLPSNRYAEIAGRVRAVCDKYDLPYTSGPLFGQFWQSYRTLYTLALPDRWLRRTSDDAPETRSERKFWTDAAPKTHLLKSSTGHLRFGLRSALARARAKQRSSPAPFGA
ncbi:acyl-CoA desaturase [Nocardia vinacea]|uniref:Acyl-CoA desaturase n=1 Tax=Nocardia vinacea TaxID=96468 RepID=A0ABZ1YY68_9NOCA|nr:acyl-CoA desaturase [Nocardia vinacea]